MLATSRFRAPRRALATVTALLTLAAFAMAAPQQLPPKYEKAPFSLMSLTVGAPNDGWQVRAKRLYRTPHIKIKSGSGNVTYGHPALVLMLRRSASDIASAAPGSVMLVGDLSSKKGGAIPKHRSHQSGRDADVGFFLENAKGKQVVVDTFVKIDGQGNAIGVPGAKFDDERNWQLVRSWLRDRRAGISHVFVARHVRNRILAYAQAHKARRQYHDAAAALLRQPSNSAAHDDHFHVRIKCPEKQKDICVEEAVSD